jgi:ABC-2 type transport system permease protein
MLGRRRTLALLALALLPAVLALVAAATGAYDDADRFTAGLVERILLPVVAALVTVVLGASVIGESRDDGTIVYIVASPIPRPTIVVAAWLAAVATALVLLVPTALVVVVAPGAAGATGVVWTIVAMSLACAAYAALSLLVSLVLRHPVLAAVLYVVLWEGSVASFAASASKLSIAAYAKVVAAEGLSDAERLNVPDVSAPVAVGVLVAICAAAAPLATRALRRAEIP